MIEIFDIVGEAICPGNLIAFSKSGQGELQVGIVAEIYKERLTYFIKSRRRMYKRGGAGGRLRTFTGYGPWKIRRGWIALVPDTQNQNRIVLVKNPLFLLNNENIAKQLEVVDMVKDAGFLPQDYIFGQSLGVELDLSDIEEDSDLE